MNPAVTEFISGNIFIRPNKCDAIGDQVQGHAHNFDHTTIFFKGAFHVKATLPDGTIREKDFYAPSYALIKKDVIHEITAIEPMSEFWCVYSHRTPQGEVSEEYDGWAGAYQIASSDQPIIETPVV